MADIAGITAVRPGSSSTIQVVQYGATISAGQVVYLNTATNEYELADASAANTASVVGIAMTPGVDGGYGAIVTSGSVVLVGGTVAAGQTFVVSATAGGIAPEADLGSGEYYSLVGVGEGSSTLKIDINATGIAHA